MMASGFLKNLLSYRLNSAGVGESEIINKIKNVKTGIPRRYRYLLHSALKQGSQSGSKWRRMTPMNIKVTGSKLEARKNCITYLTSTVPEA